MNKKRIRNSLLGLVSFGTIGVSSVTMTSCNEEVWEVINEVVDVFLSMMGYNPNDENIEDENTADDYDEKTDGTIPSKMDWSSYAPAIGNQGSYGTCVAWATGYGLKTTLDNIAANDKSRGTNANYQVSPIDLWHVMRNKYSSSTQNSCGGSAFDPAFSALINYGATTMSNVPFTNQKMSCDVSGYTGSSNKLAEYKLIAYSKDLTTDGTSYGMNPDNIKYYLTKGPVVVGAKLGERFMRWNNSNIITTDDPDSYEGGHAYHAMLVIGYDDTKSAFRIRNSWGSSDWGDNGCIWVGYNFFCSNFAFGVWQGYNSTSSTRSSLDASSSLRSSTGVDLALKVISDYPDTDGYRIVEYDIENVGNNTVYADNYRVLYTMYKKKHFHEKVVLADSKFSSDIKSESIQSTSDGFSFVADNNSVVNVDIPAGSSVAKELGGKYLKMRYKMPKTNTNGMSLSGQYYLYMALDAEDVTKDENRKNNYVFLTGKNCAPLEVLDGSITSKSEVYYGDLNDKIFNDYLGEELLVMLGKHARNGKLSSLIQSSELTHSNTSLMVVK